MATHTSIIQICKVSHKRLIYLFIFMLMKLKCYNFVTEPDDPYIKRCWVRREKVGYHTAKMIGRRTLEECKHHCEHELPFCNLIVYDLTHRFLRCGVKRNIKPFNHSLFKGDSRADSHILDLKCSRNVTICWIMNGNLFHLGLQHFRESGGTLESCMNRCIHEYPLCDAINYRYPEFGGDGCWVKTQAGPLNTHRREESMASFVLDRACYATSTTHKSAITSDSAKATTTVSAMTQDSANTHKSVEEDQTNPAGSHDSINDSFLGKYYVYLSVAAAILILTVAVIVVKHHKLGRTSATSSASSESA